jgi:hypothetical protein
MRNYAGSVVLRYFPAVIDYESWLMNVRLNKSRMVVEVRRVSGAEPGSKELLTLGAQLHLTRDTG